MKIHPVLIALALITAAPFASAAKTCAVAIEGNDQMQYNLKEIKVAADCTEVQLSLKHVGKLPATAMGHNWVLVKTPDIQAVANAGSSAGLPNNYLPKNDARSHSLRPRWWAAARARRSSSAPRVSRRAATIPSFVPFPVTGS